MLERLDLAGQLKRELDSGQVQSALFNQILHLTQPLNVAIRIQAEVPGRSRWSNESLTLVLAQRLGMHFNQTRRDADNEQRFRKMWRHELILQQDNYVEIILLDTYRVNVAFLPAGRMGEG